jgi:hypothetical protein
MVGTAVTGVGVSVWDEIHPADRVIAVSMKRAPRVYQILFLYSLLDLFPINRLLK